MAHDPKWVESGKQHWQHMEDIRAAAKKPPYAPWATVSGCATAWDIQFSGEGLSGARAYRPWGNDSSQVQNLFAPFLYWERVACKKPRPDIEGGPDAEEEEEDEEKKEEGEASGSTEVKAPKKKHKCMREIAIECVSSDLCPTSNVVRNKMLKKSRDAGEPAPSYMNVFGHRYNVNGKLSFKQKKNPAHVSKKHEVNFLASLARSYM